MIEFTLLLDSIVFQLKAMMKILEKFIAVLACVALAGCGADQEGDAAMQVRTDGPLVLAVMPDLPPYASLDEASGEVVGIDIDIVRSAAAKLGRPLKIVQAPFAALLPMVKDGKADFAACGITITEGRRRNVDFSDPYAIEGSAFLYRAGEKTPTMITAESLRVAAVEGMTQDFYLTRHGIDPIRYSTINEAVADLIAHKIDMVAYDRPAIATLAEMSNGKFAVSPLETRERYGIAVRKNCPDYLAAVNEAIRERSGK